MSISLRPLSEHVGVEITGIDPRLPMNDEHREAFVDAFNKHLLVLIRGYELSEEQQVSLCETLGKATSRGGKGYAKLGRKATFVSNRLEEGIFRDGELSFHSDLTYLEHPLKARSLHALLLPTEGGNTLFSNVGVVYDDLPQAMKDRIDNLQVRHAVQYDIDGIGYVDDYVRPVAERHPRLGHRVLTAGRAVGKEIIGMERSEFRPLLKALWARIEEPRYGYRHVWQLHDFLFWDNIALQHARTPFDPAQGRTLRAVSIDEPEHAV